MSGKLTLIILFVRRFERCMKFYLKVFDLKPVRIYREKEHPRWVEFQVGDVRLALHGGYRGPPYREWTGGGPMALVFDVKDIHRAVERIELRGGVVKDGVRKVEHVPQRELVYIAAFADPAGNQFEVQQVLEKLPEPRALEG